MYNRLVGACFQELQGLIAFDQLLLPVLLYISPHGDIPELVKHDEVSVELIMYFIVHILERSNKRSFNSFNANRVCYSYIYKQSCAKLTIHIFLAQRCYYYAYEHTN